MVVRHWQEWHHDLLGFKFLNKFYKKREKDVFETSFHDFRSLIELFISYLPNIPWLYLLSFEILK